MRSYAILLAALSTVAIAGAKARPTGRYCGKLVSAGLLVDAETTFSTDEHGRVSGSYHFQDGDAVTDGRLQETGRDSGRTKSLHWMDKYGHGRLVITFDPNFTQFDGHWGASDEVPDHFWIGQRCEEPNS
jgi:hypothetical protein